MLYQYGQAIQVQTMHDFETGLLRAVPSGAFQFYGIWVFPCTRAFVSWLDVCRRGRRDLLGTYPLPACPRVREREREPRPLFLGVPGT